MPRPKKKRTPDESGMETTVVPASFQELARLLAGDGAVSGSGTREQIEYIDLDDVQPDPRNFYELSDIDELAANIELFGLQQPLRVRDDPLAPDKVILVSGHRRREAIARLVAEGREDLRAVPCIREREAGSEALQELRLIYANAGTRRMTSAEVSKQAERVEVLLYQLKEEGYDFPGRMRDHVAEACKISKSKLARLKVIREGLDEWWAERWNEGKVPEETAYQVARLSREHQAFATVAATKVGGLERFHASSAEALGETLKKLEDRSPACLEADGAPCPHLHAMQARAAEHCDWYGNACVGRCCINCFYLNRCKDFCQHAKPEKDRLKKEQKEAYDNRKAAEAELEASRIERNRLLWDRMAAARAAAGKSVQEVFAACGRYWSESYEKPFLEAEAGSRKLTASSETPYGYMFRITDIIGLCAVADLLGVTTDYLLGRTKVNRWPPEGEV